MSLLYVYDQRGGEVPVGWWAGQHVRQDGCRTTRQAQDSLPGPKPASYYTVPTILVLFGDPQTILIVQIRSNPDIF
jgi:hypothetical protein